MSATIARLLRAGVEALRRAGVADPAGDARRLMADALQVRLDRLTLVGPDRAEPWLEEGFVRRIEARARRQPVAQIVGARLFWGREFLVTPDVLDPRPETEVLVAQALAGRFSRVLDLGTGSGCILVTLLAERPGADGIGVDASDGAVAVARSNAERHGVADRAVVARSDWFAGLRSPPFDLIVSNPPYVAADEVAGLEPEVRDWEPRAALTDGGDGLGAYRAILAGAARHLAPGGRLLLEIGPTQAAAVAAIGRAHGWGAPGVAPDLDGRDRALLFGAPGDPR